MKSNFRGLGLHVKLAFTVLGVLAGVLTGFAQPSAEPRGLSLDEALRRTLNENPTLIAADLDAEIERRRTDIDALSPPLTLEAEIENFAGGGDSSGFGSAEITLQLSRIVERGNKPELRRRLGERRVEQAEITGTAARLVLARDVTQAFIDVVALQERLALADRAVGIARQTLDIVRARVEVGRTSEADGSTASVALARAELERLGVERRLETARMRLASLWGASTAGFTRAEGDLYDLPNVDSFAALEPRIAGHPDLLRAAAELGLATARQRLAEASRQPDIAVSGGLRHFGQQNELALVLSVSRPFGSRSRAEAAIDEAELRMMRSPLEAEGYRRELRMLLYALHQELSYARTAFETLDGSIIPEAVNAVMLYEERFSLGGGTLLELVDAQDRLLALRNEAVDAARNYHSALAELEYLLGGSPGDGG